MVSRRRRRAAQQGFLHQILRARVIAAQPPGETVQIAGVRAHQRIELALS